MVRCEVKLTGELIHTPGGTKSVPPRRSFLSFSSEHAKEHSFVTRTIGEGIGVAPRSIGVAQEGPDVPLAVVLNDTRLQQKSSAATHVSITCWMSCARVHAPLRTLASYVALMRAMLAAGAPPDAR